MLNELLKQTEKQEVKNWINTTLAAKLRKEGQLNQGEVEHILDYLNSDKAPARLSKMSYDQAKVASDKWMKTQIKKGNHIIETDADVKVILRSKTTGFKFVKLIGEAAFKREGFLMGHCVASYHDKRGSEVYSLRDAKNNPHCTIEVIRENNIVQQIKGKGNGSIHPNYIKYVLKILKYFKMDVRDSEMQNLGYVYPSEEYNTFVESNFTGVKYINWMGKKYMYKNSNLVPIKK